jgi:hypothetical protein
MTYSLFCTDARIESKPDHYRVVSVDSASMGAAIKEACRLIGAGLIVWKLKGADGFTMERSDIETECLRRRGVLVVKQNTARAVVRQGC